MQIPVQLRIAKDLQSNQNLLVFCKLSRNQPTGHCFHLFAMIQTRTYLYSSNFIPQVKQARNQSKIFNRKSISRNTTHRQSLYLIKIESLENIQPSLKFFLYSVIYE